MSGLFARLSLALVPILACANVDPVHHASKKDAISTSSLTCEEPYRLTQDCSEKNGAERRIWFGSFDVLVAGNETGDVVLLMDADAAYNALLAPAPGFTMPGVVHNQATNKSYFLVRHVFDEARMKVARVRTVGDGLGSIDGYVLELEGDGYSLLKALPVPPAD